MLTDDTMCTREDAEVPRQIRASTSPSPTSKGLSADYYELPPNTTELEELILHRNMNHQIGTIFASCYRYGRVPHSAELREAKKILFYSLAEACRVLNEGRDMDAQISFPELFQTVRKLLPEE